MSLEMGDISVIILTKLTYSPYSLALKRYIFFIGIYGYEEPLTFIDSFHSTNTSL